MYHFLTKKELFAAWDGGFFVDQSPRLKSSQDAFIVTWIGNLRDTKIAEIGGGHSRVLPRLAKYNECWNIDPFQGVGQGPTVPIEQENIKIVRAEVGSFSDKLPSNYFDIVFSVSVVEHVATQHLQSFFQDVERVLAGGGETIHAIDAYLGDDPIGKGIDRYLEAVLMGTSVLEPLAGASSLAMANFHPSYVSDPDLNMWKRNKLVPRLKEKRNTHQCVSLCAGWKKSHAC